MKIAVFTYRSNPKALNFSKNIIPILQSKGVTFFLEENLCQSLKLIGAVPKGTPFFASKEDLGKDIDFFFSIGGDGTILRSVSYVVGTNIPIVGINTGQMGFLTPFDTFDFPTHLNDLIEKKYTLSKRNLLQLTKPDLQTPNFALNEIVVSRKETTSMITVDAYINDQFLNTYWADGLITSTPTGSTGYSLSCGGPIILPQTQNLIITPIAPHNLFVRPIVIDDSAHIRLYVKSRAKVFYLSLDSRSYSVSTQEEIIIERAPFSIYLVQPKYKSSHLETLREKLHWGSDKRNSPN